MNKSKEIALGLGWEERKDFVLPNEIREVEEGLFANAANLDRLESNLRGAKRVIVLVSGVSGGGKDSVVKELVGGGEYIKMRTCTTRQELTPMEAGEDPYVRMSLEEFKEREARGEFLETKPYGDDWYGSNREVIRECLETGKTGLIVINPEGAEDFLKMKEAGEEVFEDCALIYLFVMPETWRQAGRRLLKREVYKEGATNESKEKGLKKVRSRWSQNAKDLEHLDQVDFVLINKYGGIEEVAEKVDRLVNRLSTGN